MDDLVSQSYIYQTPLVHDSPVTRTQSSIENLVPETRFFIILKGHSVLSGRSPAWASRKKIGVSGREVKRLPDVSDSLIA